MSCSRACKRMTRLVYLHGFRSSSQGIKARALAAALDALPVSERLSLWTPDLPHRPAAAIETVVRRVEARDEPARTTFIGSSLGGYYATHLAERFGARAVLINPAIHPYDDLRAYRGVQVNMYSGETFEVGDAYFDELLQQKVPRITRPERYLLLVETGDEVLDYREAVAYYEGALHTVVRGGDHTLVSFPEHVPDLVDWALN